MKRLFVRIVRKGKRALSALYAPIQRSFARGCGRGPFMSSLYFCLFSRAFSREHHAVLSGVAHYSAGPVDVVTTLLRRNTHRLEKGLLMRPRRDVFALQYIEETVQAYESLFPSAEADSPVILWAHNVLTAYFGAVKSDPVIDPVRERFLALDPPASCHATERVPYVPDRSPCPPVVYDDLLALARRRKSVRWFEEKSVPRKLVDKAIMVAAESPSACNRQPFVFRIVDDPELLSRLVEIPMGVVGYGQNIPLIVAVVGQLGSFFSERDRHVIYVDGSLAAMSFVLALESQGLSTCCINCPDMASQEKALAEVMRLAPSERAVMLIAIGYADPSGKVAYSQKKPMDELRRYNFE